MTQRIITGTILALAVLLGVLYLPLNFFALAMAIVGALAYREWIDMLGLGGQTSQYYWLMATGLLVFIGAIHLFALPLTFLLIPLAIIWIIMPSLLIIHEKKPIAWLTNQNLLMLLSVVTVIGLVLALIVLKESSVSLLIYLILLIAVADSGAYFVGRAFGKHKLAPSISPGKTWEGALGGLFLSFIYSVIYLWLANYGWGMILSLTLLNIIIVPVSISGDLFESVVKRHQGLKDSGNILPGHGGILDRVDALTAAAPIFVVGLSLIA